MRKKLLVLGAMVLFTAVATGCGTMGVTPLPTTDFSPGAIATDGWEPKVDGFLVVLDASESMIEKYKGQKKFALARETIQRLNLTLPELGYQGGLRYFGMTRCPFIKRTERSYGMDAYTTAGLRDGLAAVGFAGGSSPLDMAIDAARGDLDGVSGPLAALVVSDGKEMDDAPVSAAEQLKQKFGDRLCIYTIQIGNDAQGAELLKQVADASGCGEAVNADDLQAPDAMADFVKRVFLKQKEEAPVRLDTDGDGVYDDEDLCPGTPQGVAVDAVGCPLDTDADGVYDYLDQCPGTPQGVEVDDVGCPLDTDGDGVYDYLDQCPGTPAGVEVDAKGCPFPQDEDKDGVLDKDDACPGTPRGAKVNFKGCWVLTGVTFDTASARIKASSYGRLDRVARVLADNPDVRVEVQGHTDNRGSAAYNQKLSEARAKSVRAYLIRQGVDAGRLTAKGYGFNRPTATNATEEGRAQNRRVELDPIY